MTKSGSKPKRKKPKVKRKPDKPEAPRNISPNGKIIWEFMLGNKVKGNYKDHVLFVGDRMMDQYGAYNLARKSDGDKAGVPPSAICLVHKSKLATLLGEEQGARFWDPKRRTRTNHGLKQYTAGKIAKARDK